MKKNLIKISLTIVGAVALVFGVYASNSTYRTVNQNEEDCSIENYADKSVIQKYICTICSWIYDPRYGDPDQGIPPGTPFAKLSWTDWCCPICGVDKSNFVEFEY